MKNRLTTYSGAEPIGPCICGGKGEVRMLGTKYFVCCSHLRCEEETDCFRTQRGAIRQWNDPTRRLSRMKKLAEKKQYKTEIY